MEIRDSARIAHILDVWKTATVAIPHFAEEIQRLGLDHAKD